MPTENVECQEIRVSVERLQGRILRITDMILANLIGGDAHQCLRRFNHQNFNLFFYCNQFV